MAKSRNRVRQIRLPDWLAFAIFALVAIVIYRNIFAAPFVFDSAAQIRDNWRIRQLWPAWDWLLYSQRPLSYFTFALNYAMHGYQLGGYHAVNLAIHVAAACVLFLIVRETLSAGRLKQRYESSAPWLALAVALLWLVHPLQTQSVTYTIQRMESLMGLFYLLTLYAMIRARRSPRPGRWLVASVVCCWLGMATKEVMVTAPLVMLWYAFVFRIDGTVDKGQPGQAMPRWYFPSLFASWILFVVLIRQLARYGGDAVNVAGVGSLDYALSQPGVILHYLRLCLWPLGQCLDYGWPVATGMNEIVPPALVLVALLAGVVWCIARQPAIGFVGGSFFLILGPTSSFVPIVDLAFEHRMYLPLAAVGTLLVLALFELMQWQVRRQLISRSSVTVVLALAVVSISAVLGYLTHQRNRSYESAVSVWSDVVNKAPNNSRGYNNLGAELLKQGQLQEAIEYFEEAIRIEPDYYEAYSNLGSALTTRRETERAIQVLRKAIEIEPHFAGSHANLGNAHSQLNQLEAAIQSFRRAIEIDPAHSGAHTNLGAVLARNGQIEEASGHFEMGVKLDPYDPVAHYNYGNVLSLREATDEAMRHYELAIGLNANYAIAHMKLGELHRQRGNRDAAARHFGEAIRLNPDLAKELQRAP